MGCHARAKAEYLARHSSPIMAGRFPLYTDAGVLGLLSSALKRRGRDAIRAVDLYPEWTDDDMHLAHAAREGRVLVAADEDQELCAIRWYTEGRPFRGLITWERVHERRMSAGDFLQRFRVPQPDTTPRPWQP
jgi:hypothetical protein